MKISPISYTLFLTISLLSLFPFNGVAGFPVSNRPGQDTTFVLKIENEKRVVDEKLTNRLLKEINAAIATHKLSKPYKIAMGFTRGARDVETFLFGEQIFYILAENGLSISGKPMEMPDVIPNPIPQVKVIDRTVYIILSKM